MIKFLHAADLHLDAPFAALSPEQAAERRREQRAFLTELAEAANTHDCDLVLLAGDLLDSAGASTRRCWRSGGRFPPFARRSLSAPVTTTACCPAARI